MRLHLVTLLCLLLGLSIATVDYKEFEDQIYNAEIEARNAQIRADLLVQAVKATASVAAGIYVLHLQVQQKLEPIKQGWHSLQADWNGRVRQSLDYKWAGQFGSGTEVMKITMEFESRLKGSKMWEKRVESHLFTVTPTFQFKSFGIEYKDTVRSVRDSDIQAAVGFVKEAGYYPGTVEAFSATCEPNSEILLTKVTGDFFKDARVDEKDILESTSLPELALRQILKYKTTDFEVSWARSVMGIKAKHTSHPTNKENEYSWPKNEERRNMFAKGQITGSHTYIFRHWLFIIGTSDSKKGYGSSSWLAW